MKPPQVNVLVLGTGVQASLFTALGFSSSVFAGDLTDTVGYGTLVASVLLQLLPNVKITSRYVAPRDVNYTLLNGASLAAGLQYADANRGLFDAVVLAFPPSTLLDPLAAMASVSAGPVWGDDLSIVEETLLGNPAPTDGPMLGIPTNPVLREQVFAGANAFQRQVVEAYVQKAVDYQSVIDALASLNAHGVALIAPAGDQPILDSDGGLVPTYAQTVYGISARPEVITVGAALKGPADTCVDDPAFCSPTERTSTYRIAHASGTGPTLDLRGKPDVLAPTDLLGLIPISSKIGATWESAVDDGQVSSNAAILWPSLTTGTPPQWVTSICQRIRPTPSAGRGDMCVLQPSTFVAAGVVAANVASAVAVKSVPHSRSGRTATDDEALRSIVQAVASCPSCIGLNPTLTGQPHARAAATARATRITEEGAGILYGLNSNILGTIPSLPIEHETRSPCLISDEGETR